MTNSIELLEGKYTFIITPEYQIHVRRYGEPWREFNVGDKAMYTLVAHAIELEAENAKLKQALDEIHNEAARYSWKAWEDRDE